jgi:hypothetical protein
MSGAGAGVGGGLSGSASGGLGSRHGSTLSDASDVSINDQRSGRLVRRGDQHVLSHETTGARRRDFDSDLDDDEEAAEREGSGLSDAAVADQLSAALGLGAPRPGAGVTVPSGSGAAVVGSLGARGPKTPRGMTHSASAQLDGLS